MEQPIVTFVLFAFLLSLTFQAFAIDPGALRLVLDDRASPVERRVADLFTAEVGRRTGRGLAAADGPDVAYSLVLRTDKSSGLEADGLRLATAPDAEGRLFVTGESPSGLVAGVGKLLRMSRYAPGSITIPAVKLEEAPKMPVRGMYFATHFHNFWAHDASKEKTATITIDLGQSHSLREVGLQFRNIHGVYWFIPQTVAFGVSDDGTQFAPAITSANVPKEGDQYSAEPWRYAIGKRGRYLRVGLGPSQHTGDPYPGLLELTEIEVYGE